MRTGVETSNGLDHSQIVFSQWKPVFSMRFLVFGLPFHCEDLHRWSVAMVDGLGSGGCVHLGIWVIPAYKGAFPQSLLFRRNH